MMHRVWNKGAVLASKVGPAGPAGVPGVPVSAGAAGVGVGGVVGVGVGSWANKISRNPGASKPAYVQAAP
jgi:F0F1-type ATP synthase membrane subunit c/vacuolar-type H+-ATPase subunit K